jgi:hypothetical protein
VPPQLNLGVRQGPRIARRSIMTRVLVALVFLAAVPGCVRHNPEPRREVVVHGGGPIVTAVSCPSRRPASWPHSTFQVVLGPPDPTVEPQTGTLIFEIRVDSTQRSSGAQVSVRNPSVRRDMPYSDSVVRVNVPTGRYYFRVRRIGAQTLEDSIDVRSGFVDTASILLSGEMFCSA